MVACNICAGVVCIVGGIDGWLYVCGVSPAVHITDRDIHVCADSIDNSGVE